jgi:hypothetical protein
MGDPGEGKTTYCLAVAAALTTGRMLPESAVALEPMSVVFQSAEDGIADTLLGRFKSLGGDCSKICSIVDSSCSLSLDDTRIEEVVRGTGAGLVVLDPLQSFLGAGVDMHRANEVRPLMAKLAAVAERTGCSVLIIGHLNKMATAKGMYRGLGSIDINAAARSIVVVGRMRDDPETRVAAHLKSSLAPEGQSIAFRLDRDSGFAWVGAVAITADELLSGVSAGREPTKQELALALITEMLTGGEVESNEVLARLQAHGISKSTYEIVRRSMCIQSVKRGNVWFSQLPEVSAM